MDGQSITPDKIKLQQLKELLPEAFSEGKIDWEKLKATLGEDITFSNERYVLNWAGKSDAFKVLQTPSTRTLVPAKEESLNFDETENIFIEGENLKVLKVLLKSGKDINNKIEHKADYYCINHNELVFMLEKATQEIVNSVLKERPQKVIALDRLFTGNDQLKTNTALQMKDAGIEFKTI